MGKSIYNSMLIIIAFGSFLSLSAGGVETATYCDTLTISGLSSEGNHTLPLFDPSLGNLVGVDLAVELEVHQNFSLENKGQIGQNVSADSEAVLLIDMPNLSSISVNVSSSVKENLAAYDGETDFEGSSGKTIEGTKSTGTAKEKYLEPSDFVASMQNETVVLPATIDIISGVRGNIVFSLSTVAESELCVTYTYEPRKS